MTSQFGDERTGKPKDDLPLVPPPNNETSSDGLKLPDAELDKDTALTIDGVRARITSAITKFDHQTEIDLSSSLIGLFIGANGATPDQVVTLEALLLAAHGYFRAQDADDAFISVLEITQKALQFWYIPGPLFEEVRSKWFGFIDTILQSERCDINAALSTNDELRLMATAKLLGITKRILEIDGDRHSLDTSDLLFTVTDSCRAISGYLDYSDIEPTISDLVWLTVGELADIAGLLANTKLDNPLFQLFEKAVRIAGYEEDFLPHHMAEEDDEEDFSSSLGIQFEESQDEEDEPFAEDDVDQELDPNDEWEEVSEEEEFSSSLDIRSEESQDEEDEPFSEDDVDQELDHKDEWEEVSEEELGTKQVPQIEMPIFYVQSSPNADFGVTRLLYALAKCQPRIPGDVEREHIWSCAISAFRFEHPSWNAGVLGLWTANEERAKGVVRTLLLQVFDWESDEWEGDKLKEEIPDEDDTFALLVELLAREPQTAEGLEEVFRGLPQEVQVSISDICQDALDKGDIPVEWFDAGIRDVNKLEVEIARIFTVSKL
jgi:hypothetical protein